MKISEIEMQGLLSGKCIPGDMKVNESLPAYLVRKFSELHLQQESSEALMLAMLDDSLESRTKLELVVAENAALKGGILKCNEAVENWNSWADAEDKITLHTKTPATDAMVNEIRAEGVELLSDLAGKEYQRFASDKAMQKKWKGIVLLCCDFANKLRADAAMDGE